MSALQHLIGYNHILSIPYHSQSNGVVERFNASMVVQVSKLGMRLGMYQYQNSSKTFGFWVLWFWVQLWVLGLGLVLGLGSLG
jgi:transposase InsO family protein